MPGAPLNVRASAGNASATLYWLAPSSDGNSTITGYNVISSPGAKTCSSSGALSCAISGLTNNVSYTFTVTATNSVGTSSASLASDAVTPSADADAGTTALSWGLDRIDQRNLPLNTRYIRNYSGAGVTAYIIDTGIFLVIASSAGESVLVTAQFQMGEAQKIAMDTELTSLAQSPEQIMVWHRVLHQSQCAYLIAAVPGRRRV